MHDHSSPGWPKGALWALILLGLLALEAHAAGLAPARFTKLTFDQKINARIDPSLSFRDEAGKTIRLGDYFGKRPLILDLGYYRCPMLCSLVLNGLIQSLDQMPLTAGQDFDVVCVSISPEETPALAAAKKQNYVHRYNRPGTVGGWHFLTGPSPSIERLASEVGFHYAFDSEVHQYAHPSGIVVVTPEGRIAKYLFGVAYPAPELQASLKAARSNQTGSPVKQLLILCFEHLPLIGKYSGSVMMAVRIGALLVLGALVVGVLYGIRRERNRKASAHPAANAETPRS